MTQAQFNQKKLSRIASMEAYEWANIWYRCSQKVPERSKLSVDGVYKNTAHREYLSKWLEAFILKYINRTYPTWKALKVNNTGKTVPNRIVGGDRDGEVIGILAYAKDESKQKGELDIKVMRKMPLHTIYFEVKIGNDKLSQDQKDFIQAGYGECYVVKTLDDFLQVMDGMNTD